MSPSAWLRTIKRSSTPRVRLVCFPHAGGTAGFFRSWARYVPDDVELVGVRYPGREDRIREPFAESFEALVAGAAGACLGLADVPLAFFGHSMGASVAYEVALRLQTDHGVPIEGLFVSARTAPGHERPQKIGELDDHDLAAHLIELGGTSPEALDDPELRGLVLATVRADYRVIERYRPTIVKGVLDMPLTVYYGDGESRLSGEALTAWAQVTSNTCHMRSFEGGHFYILDHGPAVLADIVAGLMRRLGGAPL